MTTTEPTTNNELAAWLRSLDLEGLGIESKALRAELAEAMRPVQALVDRVEEYGARVQATKARALADVATLELEDDFDDGVSAVVYTVTGHRAMWDDLNRYSGAIDPEEVL
jgi:hypothetical protein